MDNKLSELSKPVAYDYQVAGACIADGHNENGKWVDWDNKLSRYCPPDWMVEEGKVTGLKLLYSQEYVSALLAENERVASDLVARNGEIEGMKKRASELEAHNARLREWNAGLAQESCELQAKQEAVKSDASQVFKEIGNELGCNPDNESIMAAIDELKERLATPVRLPPPTAWMRGDDKTTFGPIFTKNKDYAESQWGDSAIALYSVPVGIKEAGFSDERNLMHIKERGRETSLIWSKNNSENGDIQLFRLVGFTVEGDEQ
ncbi:hypothetical protein QZP99_10620 [Serratia marcescens]|uniref:hypothetical protein n=1 Tax=Serratia marcescens TaxID=615 RepID=UPI002761387F|nr:hypothetical protein [Serratia marcescens]MDP8704264.1 hypothetical protein [Serratia marcescens]